ncbi:putative regulatory protein, FmdB family [Longilinea arvoryzae]|uniref:Putative regulatory protein, FmdB family n=1 Tax=Longilinea arvoryzae TaxID=360412 RepID=A0A0S7BNT9_9CHLR|nr:FmdB family zinc ribbon protein [Longilinea arvoryzae]GAP15633.1 putative regulatory protein, FmdB family [Longilinea arvoryzae]
MPIYTYRCANCGVQFDKKQKFSDQPLQWCPECGKKALNKVYQPVGIVFKGPGFYSTDNRSPSGAGRTTSSHNEPKESESTAKPAEAKKDSASTPATPTTGKEKS